MRASRTTQKENQTPRILTAETGYRVETGGYAMPEDKGENQMIPKHLDSQSWPGPKARRYRWLAPEAGPPSHIIHMFKPPGFPRYLDCSEGVVKHYTRSRKRPGAQRPRDGIHVMHGKASLGTPDILSDNGPRDFLSEYPTCEKSKVQHVRLYSTWYAENSKSQAKPSHTKPRKAKLSQTKESQAKTRHAKRRKAKPIHAKPKKAKPRKAKSSQRKLSQPNEEKPSQPKPNQGKPNEGKPNQGKPSQAKSRKAKPSQAKPRKAKPSQVQESQAKPGQTRPSQAKPSRAEPTQAKKSQAKPSQANPSQVKPSQAKPMKAKESHACQEMIRQEL
ncbi:adhesive plaque matrix protein-like [Macrobrachium nipponense]|uniref:adhesive plaque matrix protein-like n=1 Tax=Macrobrachium nipponense TaxID=159736 RepID=UPI0030C7C97B